MTDSPMISDVPAQVLEQFLQTLRESELSDELTSRIQKVLKANIVSEPSLHAALRAAILGEETLPLD